jgi:hypothetical protein
LKQERQAVDASHWTFFFFSRVIGYYSEASLPPKVGVKDHGNYFAVVNHCYHWTLHIHVIQTHEEAHIIGWMEAVKVADETNL